MIRRNEDVSRATKSRLDVPCPEGLAYDPYQIAAVDYAFRRQDTLVGDDCGLGKTIEAIAIANFLGCQQILVICPSYLKPNWQAEFLKWQTAPRDVSYIPSSKPAPFTQVTIISYELLEKHGQHIREIDWDLLIVDESHRLKNGKTDRTRQIFGGVKRNGQKQIIARYQAIKATRRIFLTGTPVLNGRPKELWPLIRAVDPTGLGSDWYAYAKRYCDLIDICDWNPQTGQFDKHVGWKWDGGTHLEELQERMRKTFMIRRLKADVMKQLAPKRRVIVPIAADRKLKKLLDEEWQEFKAYSGGREGYFEMPAFGEFAKRMQELGLSLVQPTIEMVQNELESVNKIVVMCYHNEVARQIAAAFPNAILINGEIDPNDRLSLTQLFQQDACRTPLVGTIGSAGEGLTMTAASLMLFPERDWTPGKVTQAEDRIHRRGQTEQVLYKHLVLANSLSEHQVRILIAKQDANDRMLDRKGV